MKKVAAYEGFQGDLHKSEMNAVYSLLGGHSAAAKDNLELAIKGPTPTKPMTEEAARVCDAILTAAKIIGRR